MGLTILTLSEINQAIKHMPYDSYLFKILENEISFSRWKPALGGGLRIGREGGVTTDPQETWE